MGNPESNNTVKKHKLVMVIANQGMSRQYHIKYEGAQDLLAVFFSEKEATRYMMYRNGVDLGCDF